MKRKKKLLTPKQRSAIASATMRKRWARSRNYNVLDIHPADVFVAAAYDWVMNAQHVTYEVDPTLEPLWNAYMDRMREKTRS